MANANLGSGDVSRRGWLVAAAGGALHALACTQPRGPRAASTRRPNILFIMADDLGYADLNCYGRREYETPNIDRLAREGLKLTHGYSSAPVCSSTRCALITGRYQHRLAVGLEEPLAGEASQQLGLPANHPTLPSLLRAAGYRTALVGKWHLGAGAEHGPLRHGYDRFFGILEGATDYFTHEGEVPARGESDLRDGESIVKRDGYLTELLGTEAVAEIEASARGDKPFFLSLHFTAPHWPWEGPTDSQVPSQLTSLFDFDGGTAETYAAMVRNLDANVGRVLDALTARGLAEDTIVIFTSDNGGERFSDNWPFSGMKTELLEGGIRVPTLVRWPRHIRAGTRSDQVIVSMDWLPTLLAAAGAAPDPQFPSDGENLLPVLLAQEPARARELFWRYKSADQAAVRNGSWKYLRLAGHEYLFDVVKDPRERANVSRRKPDIFARLQAAFGAWNATMLPYTDGVFSSGVKARGVMPDRY